MITRKLPNGTEERSVATNISFHHRFLHNPAHYTVEFIREDTYKMQQKTSPNVTIHHNAGAVQIGDHNTQNIVNAIQDLQNKIDAAAATPEEKTEAKGWLAKALSHPVTVSILGAAAGALVG